MEEIKLAEEERVRERAPMGYGGASIAFIAVYGAVQGALALVPIFPYVGGGGFVPLSVVFSAIGPLILGPIGGILAAVIGGFVGMFLSPATFPLGPLDVLLTGIFPAFFTAFAINGDEREYWVLAIIIWIVVAIFATVFPYIWPGIAGQPWKPLVAILGAYYWLPWFVLILLPTGTKYIPEWARGDDRPKRYISVFFAIMIGLMAWYLPWGTVYWLILEYAVDFGIVVHISYTWWVPTMAAITTFIAIPVIEALERSGLPRIPRAIW
ncbi:MAG: hypothetical protein R6V83_07565 [Candidatus Thorarchaeota archaeon]